MSDPIAYCPKCLGPLVRKPKMFHWRGRDFHGLVCEPCKALWKDGQDDFFDHVSKQSHYPAIDDSPYNLPE